MCGDIDFLYIFIKFVHSNTVICTYYTQRQPQVYISTNKKKTENMFFLCLIRPLHT